MCSDRGQNYTLGLWHVFAARGDLTSPRWEKNRSDALGYVGQAARPPWFRTLRLRRLQYSVTPLLQRFATPTLLPSQRLSQKPAVDS